MPEGFHRELRQRGQAYTQGDPDKVIFDRQGLQVYGRRHLSYLPTPL